MPFASMNGINLYYESTGVGDPALIFIHGYTCDHTDWDLQVKLFASRYRVITVDLRGHGESTGNMTSGTIDDFTGDVSTLMKSLNLSKVALIGHSMGCRVALATYLQNPKSVVGVVLVEGSQMGKGDPSQATMAARKRIEELGFQQYAGRRFAGMFFGEHNPALKDRIIARAMRLDPNYGTRVGSAFPGWDAANIERALSNLKVPLLVIQSTGQDDKLQYYSLRSSDNTPWLSLVRKIVPTARVEVIPGHGHFIMLEAPDETNELIDSFVKELKGQ
ncbi:MAG: alpha/beta hydrolase [Nitrososphaerota archaeon]|nr:alpha/beta hydrolase [Nitrososphaerota archaeon]